MKHYILCTKERLFQEDNQEKVRALVDISHDHDGLKLMLVGIMSCLGSDKRMLKEFRLLLLFECLVA